jgi:hypothetical protein
LVGRRQVRSGGIDLTKLRPKKYSDLLSSADFGQLSTQKKEKNCVNLSECM